VGSTRFREQLESLHAISVEIASLRELEEVYGRALTYCLELTDSAMGFIGLLDDGRQLLDLVAVQGFRPSDPQFYQRLRRMPVRASVFGVAIVEERSTISNEVDVDPHRVGHPPGHPPVLSFLGVPLRVGTAVIGMIGVANRKDGYHLDDERLLSTFANQVAVAIDNARLYERQRAMIAGLQQLHQRLGAADREHLLARERERIAAGLHDNIQQTIFTTGVRLGALLEDELEPGVADRLHDLRQLVSRVDDEVREVIFALAVPGRGSTGDLTSSLRSLLREVERSSGLDTNLVVTGNPTEDVAAVQDVIYGVIKEALTNVVKHAQGQMALVSLRYEADHVDVVVQDDGVGAPELILAGYEDSYLHFGLRNMRERILALEGDFEVANGDEGGLTVKVSVPVKGRPA
jgi:signal transduction histidine kinase